MNSPVEKILLSLITFERTSRQPVYRQISAQIGDAIRNNLLRHGSKMPGTRQFAALFEIHRKTAIAVYEELQLLGFLDVKPNKSASVIYKDQKYNTEFFTENRRKPFENVSFSFKRSNILDNPFEFSSCEFSLNDGIPDTRLFSPALLSGYYSANLKRRQNQKNIGRYNADGSEYFKLQFKNYLNSTRGLHLDTQNLLITRSTEMTLFILSELLLSPEDTVVVGSLSYFAVNMIFQKSGAKIITIPVDEAGLDISALEKICRKTKIRMLYLAAHCHYPTTVCLSADRRKLLLQLSDKYGFIIIEDDYDYDFQYEKGGFLPFAAQDYSGNIIYIGSFGRSLAPGFRTGFAVSAPEFISEMKKYLGIIDKQGDIVMEQALGEMIEQGEIGRHVRKSLQVYRQRRDFFAEFLTENFPQQLNFKKPESGMAFWIELKTAQNLAQISEAARQCGLFIPRNILYQNKNLCAMRIGFASYDNAETQHVLGILQKVLT